jgi:hypothetical protein
VRNVRAGLGEDERETERETDRERERERDGAARQQRYDAE